MKDMLHHIVSIRIRNFGEKFRVLFSKAKPTSKGPSWEEVLGFLREEARPYRLELLPEPPLPVWVDVEREVILLSKRSVMAIVLLYHNKGQDWREWGKCTIAHEKAHKDLMKWFRASGVSLGDFDRLADVCADYIIDMLYMPELYRRVFGWVIREEIEKLRKAGMKMRGPPMFMYAAPAKCLIANIVTRKDIEDAYGEVECETIFELAEVFKQIKRDEDILEAFKQVEHIYRDKRERIYRRVP